VQGFLNFYEGGLEDGGLEVVPKSHTIFNKIFSDRPNWKSRSDFITLATDKKLWEQDTKEAGLSPIKVCCKAGDFVLWDSRTIHSNSPATSARKAPEDGSTLPLRRLVAYICMTPTKRLKPDVIEKRITAYKKGLTTSHWPEECNTPSARSNSKPYKPIELTAEQKELIPLL